MDPLLTEPTSDNDLHDLIEHFKLSLTAFATGSKGALTDGDYLRIRRILLSHPKLAGRLPPFVKTCRSSGEFWEYIKGAYGSYAERRRYLADVFNPLLDDLESSQAATHAEYEDLGLLDSGGFGRVHRFRHKLLDMVFAFKFFSPAFEANDDESQKAHLARFFREARMLFQLRHRSIIQVHDVGMYGKRPYIRMEYFEGQNLNNMLRAAGPIPAAKALVLVREVADAISHAHGVGIVHRDIKPSNIMVARPNKFRVIDFGLGIYVEHELMSRLTRLGEAVAGGHYTAPELAADPRLVDPRSDIYSLGAIWYQLLLGRPPAGVDARSALLGVKGVDRAYADVVCRCISDVSSRFGSCTDVVREVERLQARLEREQEPGGLALLGAVEAKRLA